MIEAVSYNECMDLLHVIILGAVEGLTEFLPISSTGHLIIAARLLNLTQTNFLKSFEIAIQLGAILSVIVYFRKSLFIDRKLMKKVIVGFIPTGTLGFILYKLIKNYLLGNTTVVLWSLLLGGIIMIVCEYFHKEKNSKNLKELSYKDALMIGLAQAIAVIPGVSRSAATILGGLFMKLNRESAVQFSFLLAIPTLLAATGYDLLKNASGFSADEIGVIAVGFIVAFLTALVSIKFLVSFVKKHTFLVFGIYRIMAAGVLWWILK